MRSEAWNSYRSWRALLPILCIALLARGILVFDLSGYVYASGADYGQHIFYSEQYLELGRLPSTVPNYQLGNTQWAILPGGSLTFSIFSALSGTPPFETVPSILVYGLIEVVGMYFLSWRIFRNQTASIIAALVLALLPIDPQMIAWGNYPNIIALAFIPWIFLTWLNYWETPSVRNLAITVVILVGTLSIHHLTSAWIGVTVALFSVFQVLAHPIASLRKLIPIGLVALAIGIPILLKMLAVWSLIGSSNVLGTTNSYDMTRIVWPIWSDLTTPLGLLFVSAGFWMFLWSRSVRSSEKTLIGAYLLAGLLFGFGWLLGLKFYYTRAIYYFGIPIALGFTVFVSQWHNITVRLLFTTILLASLGGIVVEHAITYRYQFQALTPGAVEAAQWIEQHSNPNDIVIEGTLLGFQFPRLLNRPQMVGLPPDLIGNPQEIKGATIGFDILTGDQETNSLLDQWPIRYVVVNKNNIDRPDPQDSRKILDSNPRFQRAFENASVLIYSVQPVTQSF